MKLPPRSAQRTFRQIGGRLFQGGQGGDRTIKIAGCYFEKRKTSVPKVYRPFWRPPRAEPEHLITKCPVHLRHRPLPYLPRPFRCTIKDRSVVRRTLAASVDKPRLLKTLGSRTPKPRHFWFRLFLIVNLHIRLFPKRLSQGVVPPIRGESDREHGWQRTFPSDALDPGNATFSVTRNRDFG